MALWSIRLRIRRLRSSESWVVGVASRSGRTKPITKRGNVICDWFIPSLLLPTPRIWFSHKRNEAESEENGNVLISSHSDSVDPMTPLTTPILRFPKVISALTTPITSPTPTPSQAKTSLDKIQVPTNSHEAWATCGRTNKVMGGGIGEFCFLYRFPCMNFLGQCMYIF